VSLTADNCKLKCLKGRIDSRIKEKRIRIEFLTIELAVKSILVIVEKRK
jgi:hypothetical protein